MKLSQSARLSTRRFSFFFVTIVAAVFLAQGTTRTAAAAAAAEAVDDSENVPGYSDWLSRCRTAGFDPWHLACSTCDILPTTLAAGSKLEETCRDCCQVYKGIERMRKPYESAILFQPKTSGGGAAASLFGGGGGANEAIEELLEKEWSQLVKEKGKQRLLHISKDKKKQKNEDDELDDDDDAGAMNQWESLFAGGGRFSNPPVLLFFEEALPITSKTSMNSLQSASLEDLSQNAKEIITLSRWSKDDIKDMLMTLLP